MSDDSPDRPFEVLFLCTGNSARSILAEAVLKRHARGRFRASSAGSYPQGRVHPMAIELLRERGYETEGLRSKSWDEFATPEASPIDLVVTVCDNAAGEACPVWPGAPATVHWGLDDPAAAEGTADQQRESFRSVLLELERRIGMLCELPLESLDSREQVRRLRAIAQNRASSRRNA